MIIFKIKHYTYNELNALLNSALAVKADIYRNAGCEYQIKDCRKCKLKNLCKDVQESVKFLSSKYKSL